MCRLYGKGTKVSLEKYIKIVERVNIDDPGSYKVPEPIRNLGDGFETVNHNGQKGIKDTQTGKLILMSTKLPNAFNIVTVQDGREVTEYGLNFNELGPATQRALQKIGAGGVQETYESSEQVRSIVQRMMEDARVPQKPRQGPLRPQTGAGKHKDKKRDQKQGKEKHKKPFMEQDNATGHTTQRYQAGPIDMQVTKDPKGNVVGNNSTYRVSRDATMKIQKPIGSQITTTTGQANTPDAQKDVDDLLSPQGVAQRRKLDPAQFAKFQQGVAEGSGKNVVKSVKVGNFRHDLVDTGFGWQVRIYNGDELYDTGMSKNSEQKGLAALEDAVAYTEKQTRTKRQGVSEGWGFDQWGHDTWTDAQKEVARKKKNEKQRAQRQQNKDQQNKDQQKSKEQGVSEGYSTLDLWNMSPKEVVELLDAKKITYDEFHAYQDLVINGGPDEDDDFDYTDYSMRQGERGMEEGVAEGGWDGTRGWEKRNPLGSDRLPQDSTSRADRMQAQDDELKQSHIKHVLKKYPKLKRSDLESKSLPELIRMLRGDLDEAIQRDLKLPDSYYLQLSSGAKSDLKNLYINYILESVSGVKKDTLETVSYPELKNIVRMIEEKQKGVDGKACWKGYKRMGTKKKGRRTVDNCVKAESLQEKSPPGFKGTVKAMKKHPELTKGKTKDGKEKNPWALAWHMKNKGYKSHKKADGSDKD